MKSTHKERPFFRIDWDFCYTEGEYEAEKKVMTLKEWATNIFIEVGRYYMADSWQFLRLVVDVGFVVCVAKNVKEPR